MDKAWILILITLSVAVFYQVVKMAVRNGILEARSELEKRLKTEEKKEKDVEE